MEEEEEKRLMKIRIGIDPGVNTGIAVTVNGRLTVVKSVPIHQALDMVKRYKGNDLFVRVEDARQRRGGLAPMSGVGSIRRDCKIWEDFLKDHNIFYFMVKPVNKNSGGRTKMNARWFELLTGWKKKTNEHGRDAAMLVFGINV